MYRVTGICKLGKYRGQRFSMGYSQLSHVVGILRSYGLSNVYQEFDDGTRKKIKISDIGDIYDCSSKTNNDTKPCDE